MINIEQVVVVRVKFYNLHLFVLARKRSWLEFSIAKNEIWQETLVLFINSMELLKNLHHLWLNIQTEHTGDCQSLDLFSILFLSVIVDLLWHKMCLFSYCNILFVPSIQGSPV